MKYMYIYIMFDIRDTPVVLPQHTVIIINIII